MNTKKLFDFVEEKIDKIITPRNLLVLPIVGKSDTGKDMLATFSKRELANKNISSKIASISSVLKLCADHINEDYSGKNGRQILREIYQETSYKFSEDTIPKILCNSTLDDALIVPGCRAVQQMKRFQDTYKSGIITPSMYLEASDQVRLLIMRRSGKYNSQNMSEQELIQKMHENDEKENGEHNLNDVPGCKEYCGNIILNTVPKQTDRIRRQLKDVFTQYKFSIEP